MIADLLNESTVSLYAAAEHAETEALRDRSFDPGTDEEREALADEWNDRHDRIVALIEEIEALADDIREDPC